MYRRRPSSPHYTGRPTLTKAWIRSLRFLGPSVAVCVLLGAVYVYFTVGVVGWRRRIHVGSRWIAVPSVDALLRLCRPAAVHGVEKTPQGPQVGKQGFGGRASHLDRPSSWPGIVTTSIGPHLSHSASCRNSGRAPGMAVTAKIESRSRTGGTLLPSIADVPWTPWTFAARREATFCPGRR